jgi:hypothetical protein
MQKHLKGIETTHVPVVVSVRQGTRVKKIADSNKQKRFWKSLGEPPQKRNQQIETHFKLERPGHCPEPRGETQTV